MFTRKGPFLSVILASSFLALGANSIAAPLCLIGSPNEMRLQNQLTGHQRIADGRYLEQYRLSQATSTLLGRGQNQSGCLYCAESNGTILGSAGTLLRSAFDVLRPRQRFISPACVQSSVERVLAGLSGSRGPNGQSTQRFICNSDRSAPTEMQQVPCVTSNYVHYISDAYNGAIRCLTSNSADNHIDAQLAFMKLNNESAFGGFLRNSGGIGSSQMTSIALAEMTNTRHEGARKLREYMRRRGESCSTFRGLMNGISVSQPPGCSGECFCQFTSVGNGMARNALVGIGLYLYYRDWKSSGSITSELAAAGLSRRHPHYKQIRDYLTLVAFGADGPAGAQALIRRMSPLFRRNLTFNSIKKVVSEQPPANCSARNWPVRNGNRCLSFYNPYLGAIRQRMTQVFGSADHQCTVEGR